MKTPLPSSLPVGRAGVMGLGATGVSCIRYLRQQGYQVVAFDSRTEPPRVREVEVQYPDVRLHLGHWDPHLFSDLQFLVVSPGVSLRHPVLAEAARQGLELIGDIELFARVVRRPVIAITGSNGKSTVTTVTGEICRKSGLRAVVAGNIGVPVLDALTHQGDADLYVLELSSFQLETTSSLDARASTVLNVSPDHMDRYADFEEYAAAKARVFSGNGVMVLNRDDARVHAMAIPERDVRYFSLGPPTSSDDYGILRRSGVAWLARGDQALMPTAELTLQGTHNWANVLASLALAAAVGVDPLTGARAAARVVGLPHRAELVAEQDRIRWINDSKGTNVGATAAALEGMETRVVLIAGGDGKGADFRALRGAVGRRVRALVLFGRDAPLLEQALGDLCPVHRALDLEQAVLQARSAAQPGDVVLLSPACASFDMFRNFEHRGDEFRRLVQRTLGVSHAPQ